MSTHQPYHAGTPTGPPLIPSANDAAATLKQELEKRKLIKKDQFSDLLFADKNLIIHKAAIYLDNSNNRSEQKEGQILPDKSTYIGRLTCDVINLYQEAHLSDDASTSAKSIGKQQSKQTLVLDIPNDNSILKCTREKDFLDQSVAAVEACIKDNNTPDSCLSHASSELDPDELEAAECKKTELAVIGRYSKWLLAAFVALCLAAAFMFWPGLIQALPIGFDTAGQIAFGFCALSGVFLAIAAVIRLKSIGKNLSPIDTDSNLAKPPKPPWYVDLAAIVFFAACMAALVLFSAAALNFSLPLQTDAINSAGSMVTYICGGVLGLSLCFPAFFALRSLCCPNSCACCDQGISDNKGQEVTYASRAAYVAGVGKLSSDAPANVGGSDARDNETCGCFPSWHN